MKKDDDGNQDRSTEANQPIPPTEQQFLKANNATMKAKENMLNEEQPLTDSEMTSEISFGDKDE